jgi:hypothetical protein
MVKAFYVLNPTDTGYEFVWEQVGVPSAASARTTAGSSAVMSAIRCLTPRGMILAGSRTEMAFEYTPYTSDTVEAFYRFLLPSHSLSQPFVVAGSAREPRLSLDRPALVFRPLLVGASSAEPVYLSNDEDAPFTFEWAPGPLALGGGAIRVVPERGTVQPHSRLAITVTFAPPDERAYAVSLVCNVKGKSLPLQLTVKGDGYAIHDKLTLEDASAASTSSSAAFSARGGAAGMKI